MTTKQYRKVNESSLYDNTTRCEICSKVTIKMPERRHWRCSDVFFVKFEHISHLLLVFLLLTLPTFNCRLDIIPENPENLCEKVYVIMILKIFLKKNLWFFNVFRGFLMF